jgi:hypothetical protein
VERAGDEVLRKKVSIGNAITYKNKDPSHRKGLIGLKAKEYGNNCKG